MPRGRSRSRSAGRRIRSASRAPSRTPSVSQGNTTATYNRPRRGKGFSGKTVKSLINYVKTNLPAPEKKYILNTQLSTAFNADVSTGLPNIVPLLINGLTRGDTVQERAGDHVNLGRGKLKGNLVTTNGASIVRIMVVMDKKPNGTALNNSAIFGTANPSSYTFLDFNNRDVYSRYTILAEQVFATDHFASDAADVNKRQVTTTLIDISWNCNNYVASYKRGNSGTVADIDDGAVYILVQQSEAVGQGTATGKCTLYGNCVQYFTDL